MDVQPLRGRLASALLLSLLLAELCGCSSFKDSVSEWWSPTRDGGVLDSSADKPYEPKPVTRLGEKLGDKPDATEDDLPPDEPPARKASHVTPAAASDAALRKSLGKDAWALNIVLPGAANLEPTARWRNPSIESTLRLPPEKRPSLTALLEDQDPILAANAAIVLTRWGQGDPAKCLAATVRNEELRLPVRRAAVEALGGLKSPSPASALRELLKEYGEFAGPTAHSYSAELHADLLVELAKHVKVGPQPVWVTPLKSPAPQVRIVALRCWSEAPDQSLPASAMELRGDNDVQVRSAALRMLGARRDPKAIEHLRRALDDFDLNVRLAAISALGDLGTAEARATLDKLRLHTSELMRATSVEAQAACHADAGVAAAVDDKSWRVRLAVANALKNDPAMADRNPREAARMLLQLVADKNPQVQQTAINAAAEWSMEQGGPALFLALRDGGYQVRKTAAQRLMERWATAADFPIDGSADSRIAAIERLHSLWTAEFGGGSMLLPAKIEAPRITLARFESQFRKQMLALKDDDRTSAVAALPAAATPADVEAVRGLISQLNDAQLPKTARRAAVQSLKQLGPPVLPALEQLAADDNQHVPDEVFADVLPDVHPAFAALDQLRSNEPTQRWAGADKLLELALDRPLSPLTLERLAAVMATQKEPLVWQPIMAAVTRDGREPAVRIAYMAATNESPEIRRRACEYMVQHPNARHAATLIPLLDDTQGTVVSAAVKALGAGGGLEDPAPLVALLTRPDKQVRLEAATSLTRLGATEGIAALERLAADPDADLRRGAATAIGQLAEPVFVPTLILLLEDRHDIARAALDSLAATVGKDVAATRPDDESPPTVAERIRRWQRWYQESNESTDGR